MKKKLLVKMLSVSLATIMLAGCGNKVDKVQLETEVAGNGSGQSNTGEQLETGNVALTVWVEKDNIDNLQKMVDSFKQKYAGQANFDITIEARGDADTLNNVLGDVNNAADVFSMADDQLYSLISGGAVLPVVNQDTVKAANMADAVDAACYQGTMYAYPYTADNGYFLYYNKEYLSETDVQSLDRILEVAAENGKKMSMFFNSGWYMYSFFGNSGLEVGINDDGVTNHCNWNSTDGNIKGVDIAQSLFGIAAHPGFIAQTDDDFVANLKSGECIAGISGVWNEVAIQDAWGSNYNACKLPTYTCNGQQIQMASFKGYKMFCVSAYSKYPGWAHKLAEWITNEENQTLRLADRHQGPSNINAAASDAVNDIPAIKAVIDQSQYAVLQRIGNSYWTSCENFADTILQGNPKDLPLQDLMDRLTDGIAASAVQ